MNVVVAALLVTGAAFMLLAGIGLVRLPDLLLRMSATSKAATLGASLMLLGAAAHFGTVGVAGRAIVIAAFLFLTAPVAAHAIGRAGYRRGSPLWEGMIADELGEHATRADKDARAGRKPSPPTHQG
jgi:multicomponent Na+:H+ antiporter subunit G